MSLLEHALVHCDVISWNTYKNFKSQEPFQPQIQGHEIYANEKAQKSDFVILSAF